MAGLYVTLAVCSGFAETGIQLDTRRDLFVDDFLIERMDGVALKLHEPRPAGVALEFDKPIEGRYCGYVTVFQALPPDFPLQPIFLGHYHDVFEKVGGEWRFKSRNISPDLIGDLRYHRADMA